MTNPIPMRLANLLNLRVLNEGEYGLARFPSEMDFSINEGIVYLTWEKDAEQSPTQNYGVLKNKISHHWSKWVFRDAKDTTGDRPGIPSTWQFQVYVKSRPKEHNRPNPDHNEVEHHGFIWKPYTKDDFTKELVKCPR